MKEELRFWSIIGTLSIEGGQEYKIEEIEVLSSHLFTQAKNASTAKKNFAKKFERVLKRGVFLRAEVFEVSPPEKIRRAREKEKEERQMKIFDFMPQ